MKYILLHCFSLYLLCFSSNLQVEQRKARENEPLRPIDQIQLHESMVIKAENLVIVNEAPTSFDQELVGMMISISFQRKYNSIFTKKEFPGGFFLFDIGKIVSIESGVSDECAATINVDYGKNGGICNVYLSLSDYAPDTITISKKSLEWRLLKQTQ
jgi:hypothetical protein